MSSLAERIKQHPVYTGIFGVGAVLAVIYGVLPDDRKSKIFDYLEDEKVSLPTWAFWFFVVFMLVLLAILIYIFSSKSHPPEPPQSQELNEVHTSSVALKDSELNAMKQQLELSRIEKQSVSDKLHKSELEVDQMSLELGSLAVENSTLKSANSVLKGELEVAKPSDLTDVEKEILRSIAAKDLPDRLPHRRFKVTETRFDYYIHRLRQRNLIILIPPEPYDKYAPYINARLTHSGTEIAIALGLA